MADQHYLPAAFIGRFSVGRQGRLRKRPIWVRRVGGGSFQTTARHVAYQDGLYDVTEPSPLPYAGDGSWRYEARLTQALDALGDARRPLDGRLWAEVLVPFVSSLFIRGIDFEARYRARMGGLMSAMHDENDDTFDERWRDTVAIGRTTDWQRLLAPTMAAQWTVFHGSGRPILPTSDLGYCLMNGPDRSCPAAYAIPIDPCTVLAVFARRIRRLLDWNGRSWTANVQHVAIADEGVHELRHALHQAALNEVYGPTNESVDWHRENAESSASGAGAQYLINAASNRWLIPYVEDYFKVLRIVDGDWSDAAKAGEVDWEVVSRHWSSTIQMHLKMPRYPGGLILFGHSVYIDLGRFTADHVKRDLGSFQTASQP